MEASDIPEDVRADLDGKGAEPKSFAVWMSERTNEEQDRMFGALNASRWRAGTISQTELLRQAGRSLPLSEFVSETP